MILNFFGMILFPILNWYLILYQVPVFIPVNTSTLPLTGIVLSFQFLKAERQKACRNLIKDYFNTLSKYLVSEHKNMQAMEKQNRKILQVNHASFLGVSDGCIVATAFNRGFKTCDRQNQSSTA